MIAVIDRIRRNWFLLFMAEHFLAAERSFTVEHHATVDKRSGTEPGARKIIHVDCDCFFAAVEVRDNPALLNKPIVVGGSPNGRGVVATASYEARKFGVRSAMSSAQALKLCPHLIFVKPRMDVYRTVSQQIHTIFSDYTDLIEPLSLDEAYLDVSESTDCKGSATLMAEEIRARIEQVTGITASAGVAPNKFLAKIASDWNKPNGVFVVTPAQVEAFVVGLPVGKIHGVGKVMQKKLSDLGIKTCGDLRALDLLTMVERFGSFGPRLYDLARGKDNREVRAERRRKSLSVEHTFERDLDTFAQLEAEVPALLNQLETRLQKRLKDDYLINKLFVKVKFNDFVQTTLDSAQEQLRSCAGSQHEYIELLKVACERKDKPIRLIGLGVGLKDMRSDGELTQLDLFDSDCD
ncbi:DNA polymerase IV [Litoribacillus peritrichatus]|uniref:DNA polymerase IV n=2 Tax=Litoribacillus peritrichatus TaxID=718191 RepID=A0ABP7M1B5_9GAMM